MYLTSREAEVLKLIIDELKTDEIAQQMGIARSTVETHRRHLFLKFGVKSMVGLVKEALRMGLV